MFFKVIVVVVVLAVAANSMPGEKFKRQIPTPPMPPGVPAPPMPPGMIFAFADLHRNKRQAETTPPSRVARQAPEQPKADCDPTQPSRVVRQAPEQPPPPARVARSVFGDQEVPKTIAQEAYFSKITTINGEK